MSQFIKTRCYFIKAAYCFLLLVLFIGWSGKGLAQIKISGSITDTTDHAIGFVSVMISTDSVFLAGTIADEKGYFEFILPDHSAKTIQLKCSMAGYLSATRQLNPAAVNTDMRISLKPDAASLRGITVTSNKLPLITRRPDRYIINVENSFLANGNSALEVLQRSPGTWVDNNGNITLRGNRPVTVMINDVVQRLPGEELANFLRSLRSEEISRIEVIHNPSAEFEAGGSGGILHIILKKTRKNGLNGSVNAQYRQQGSKNYANAATALNYKIKDLYLTGTFAYSKDRRYIFERAGIVYDNGRSYYSTTDRNEELGNRQYRLGIGYDLSPAQSISVQTLVTHTMFDQSFRTNENNSTGTQTNKGTGTVNKARQFGLVGTTLNYLWKIDTTGEKLQFIADYTDNDKQERNEQSGIYDDPALNTVSRNRVPVVTRLYSMQADYTRPLKNKTELKAGTKLVTINRDNDLETEEYLNNSWAYNPARSNRFIYKERLWMGYTTVEKKIKKTTIKAGLRIEQSNTQGNSVTLGQQFTQQYTALFPSLYLAKVLDEETQRTLYFNYSRRIKRPGLNDLNPARIEFSSYTAMQGDPELLPEYAHNLVAGYKFDKNYLVSIYYTRSVNAIYLAAHTTGNYIDYRSENINNTAEYGAELNAAFILLKGWSVNNDFSIYHSGYHYNNIAYSQTPFFVRSVHAINLKKFADLDVVANYRSAYTYSNLQTAAVFSVDMGCSKKLLHAKGILRLNVNDLFNTSREKELTEGNESRILFYRKRITRTAAVSFIYNFSTGKKFSNKKVEPGNSEERSRIGN